MNIMKRKIGCAIQRWRQIYIKPRHQSQKENGIALGGGVLLLLAFLPCYLRSSGLSKMKYIFSNCLFTTFNALLYNVLTYVLIIKEKPQTEYGIFSPLGADSAIILSKELPYFVLNLSCTQSIHTSRTLIQWP